MKVISQEDVYSILRSHERKSLISVDEVTDYKSRHIRGSENIPLSAMDFKERLKLHIYHDDDPVVFYDCQGGNMAHIAAQKAEELGYRQVFVYQAGCKDWKAAGHDLERDQYFY